ncbi:MAG: energy-coupling factor transporter ATPase [Christensenellaceae bacterium]|jgi:energy-coupling factor transport system ATP-binding protein|nr:energy-coupling factor transporter ATPase [Christensenellaceae bacterium]
MPIEVSHLSHVYMPGSPFSASALEDVSLRIEDGEFAAVIGHTGSGKSTLVQHFNGLIRPSQGKVLVNGLELSDPKTSLKEVRRQVGLVFQYPEYQLFEESVELDIGFGPKNLGLPKDEIAARVRQALADVHLPEELLQRSPFDLSGGQKRRVAIGGVLAMEPSILILDEPTAGLDPRGREEILSLIQGWHRKGRTIVMVSHSMDDVSRLAERVYVMSQGRLAMEGSPAEVFSRPDELLSMGLDLPAAAKLRAELAKKGFALPKGIHRMEEIETALLAFFLKGGAA